MAAVKRKKRQIDAYNTFRGICAIGILFSHMSYLGDAVNPFWRTVYTHFMRFGSRCTSFFFIVSGFLLVYTWKDEDFGIYIKKKLKRLYPLTIVVFLLAVVCSYVFTDTVNAGLTAGSPLWIVSAILNVLLLKAFIPVEEVFYSFHGPSWYISFLFVFYVVGYFIIKKLKKNPGKAKKTIWFAIVIAYVAQFILCMAIDNAVENAALSNARLYLSYVNPYFRIFGECLLGAMLCEYMPLIQKRLGARRRQDLFEIAATLVFFGFFVLNNIVGSSIWNAWIWFVPVGILLIVFYPDDGFVSGIARTRPCQFIGNISFEIYMTHAFVYEGIPVIAGIFSESLENWVVYHAGTRFVITLIASLIFAWLVHVAMNKKERKSFIGKFARKVHALPK